MSNERVKPLFEDASASPEMRNFITMARSDGPTQGELDKLAKRLGPVLGVSAGLVIASQAAAFGSAPSGVLPGLVSSAGAGAVGAGSVGAGLTGAAVPAAAKGGLVSALFASTSAKLVAVGLSVGVAGVGAWQLQSAEPPAARTEQSAAAPAQRSERPSASKAIAAAPAQVEAAPSQVASGQSVSDQAAPAEPSAPVTPPGARVAASAASRAGVDAPAPPREVRSPSVVPAAVVETGLAQQPAAQVTPSEPAAPVQMVAQPSELSLIRGAQAAARAGRAEALGLIAQHEQLYPRGALAQEREVLAIELLLRAGHTAEASTRARRFELTYTGSAHLARLRALLKRSGAK